MTKNVENFEVGTNNLVSFILTRNGSAVPGLQNATSISIKIGSVTITRASNNLNGVDFSQGGGKIVINPAKLTESMASLKNQQYRVMIRVIDPGNTNGTLYGGIDNTDSLYFSVSRPIA